MASSASDVLIKIQQAARFVNNQPIGMVIQLLRDWQKAIKITLGEPSRRHKKILERIYNHADSLADGLRSHDADMKDVKAFKEDLQKAIDECDAADQAENEQKLKRGEWVGEEEDKEDNSNPTDNTEAVLKKYNKYSVLIPQRLKRPTFFLTHAPVIPITAPGQPGFMLPKLKQSRLSTDTIDYYPILNNQIVLGMDDDWLMENFGLNGKQAQQKPYDIKAAVDHVAGIMQHRFKKNYTMIGAPYPRASVLWVWLLTDKMAADLRKCVYGGNLQVSTWGFPFKFDERKWTQKQKTPLPQKPIKVGSALTIIGGTGTGKSVLQVIDGPLPEPKKRKVA